MKCFLCHLELIYIFKKSKLHVAVISLIALQTVYCFMSHITEWFGLWQACLFKNARGKTTLKTHEQCVEGICCTDDMLYRQRSTAFEFFEDKKKDAHLENPSVHCKHCCKNVKVLKHTDIMLS